MSGRCGNTELLQEDGLRAAGTLHGEGPVWTEVNLDNTFFFFIIRTTFSIWSLFYYSVRLWIQEEIRVVFLFPTRAFCLGFLG